MNEYDQAIVDRQTLITYLLMKARQMDWHGVSDAANDIRELEARYPEIRK